MEQIILKWNGKQCGVYCIKNKVNGKIYIGSSKNCYHRVRSQHFDKLQRKVHTNPHLQSSWNKYGKENFESFCVEICDPNVLTKREQTWINKTKCLNPKVGYNINVYADRPELTEKQCEKISMNKIGKSYRKGIPSGIREVKNKYGISWLVVLTFHNKDFYLGNFKKLKTAIEVRKYALPRIINEQTIDREWISTLRTSNRKPVLQLDKMGKVIKKFDSLAQTSEDGYLSTSVGNCIAGRCKTYRGFLWEFAK